MINMCYNGMYPKKEGGKMSSSTLNKKNIKDKAQDFESYLQARRFNTTYNGIELETAGWQKELFGFKENKQR